MDILNRYTTEVEGHYGKERQLKVGLAIRDFALNVFMFILLMNCFTIVPAGHVKVQQLFGKVSDNYLVEGFHFVNPLVDFTEYDTRNQTYTIDNIMVPSQDKLKTDMDISVIYRIDPAHTPSMKREIGTIESFDSKYLIPKVRSLLREVGKGVPQSQDFFLDHVQQEMQRQATEKLNEFLNDKGAYIETVLFRDVTLPQLVLTAIQQTKQRQEEINREEANLMIVEKQAQQQVKQAEAKATAAESNATAKRTEADAEAYRIEAEATATANANRKITGSLTDKLIRYNSVSQWDGKYPTTMMSSGTDIMMALPSK